MKTGKSDQKDNDEALWLSGGMADTQDLKSCEGLPSCGFESRLSY